MGIGSVYLLPEILVRFEYHLIVSGYGNFLLGLGIVPFPFVHTTELKFAETRNIHFTVVFETGIDD